MKHSRWDRLHRSFARGFFSGFFAAAPVLCILFLIEDEAGILPAPAFCPASISLKSSDAELRFFARALSKAGCTLIFASSEGAGHDGAALHEILREPGITVVRDYEGFAPLRALAYLKRTHLRPRRIIVIVNHHYARSSNRPLPDLGETWFGDAFAQSRLREPGILKLYMRDRPGTRLGVLRELFGRWKSNLVSGEASKPEQIHLETRRDSIADLAGTPFALGIEEICRENETEIVLFPLRADLERSFGLDPEEQTARIAKIVNVCKKVRTLPETNAWLDRIHWNEAGRRVMAAWLTAPSLP